MTLSGYDTYYEFIKSERGKEAMDLMIKAASIIMSHNLPLDPLHNINHIEFRQMFAKCFLHMIIGCDEEGRPVIKEAPK